MCSIAFDPGRILSIQYYYYYYYYYVKQLCKEGTTTGRFFGLLKMAVTHTHTGVATQKLISFLLPSHNSAESILKYKKKKRREEKLVCTPSSNTMESGKRIQVQVDQKKFRYAFLVSACRGGLLKMATHTSIATVAIQPQFF